MFRKNKLAMLVGEFLGTGVLTLTILSIKNSQLGLPYFIASAAGLSVVLLTLALAGISGAVFNPAMTIALWTVRKLRSLQALTYILVQLFGAACAWWLFAYFAKIHQHVPNNGAFDARVMVAEALGTFIFAFSWAAAIYQRFNLYAKAVAIGGGLTLGSFVASLASSGLLNPAVALGTRSWGWLTYVLGPVLGAIIGFNLYNILFVKTEVAEIEESKAENTELNATITNSVVAADIAGRNRTATAKAQAVVVKKNLASGTSRTKTVSKVTTKPASTKRTSKSRNPRRKNPNAV